MKKLSLFLLTTVCFGISGGVSANVATTAGDNLTAYNGGTSSSNNSYNTKANARSNAPSSNPAKANFGNCEAVILRCATPKCSSGGCVDTSVTRPIVAGCVTSNGTCKKHGDALIDAITAQLVAQSTATANAQAAAAAVAQSNAQVEQMQMQMQQMQQSMQESMNAMQMQMQQQTEAANQQLQNALAEQRDMMNEAQAAAAAATAASTDSNVVPAEAMEGLSVAEQVAVKNNMDPEILVRSQVTGQIEQTLQDANLKVKELKETLQRITEYAGCDKGVNRCTGPRRVKKFKDLANEFFDPFDDVADKMYDALYLAMSVGVDVNDLIMMLSGACNLWGKYLCEPCNGGGNLAHCLCDNSGKNCFWNDTSDTSKCRLIGTIGAGESVQQELVNNDIFGNIRVACASDKMQNISILAGVSKRRKKSGLGLEVLQEILSQDEYGVVKKAECKGGSTCFACYGGASQKKTLENWIKKKRTPKMDKCWDSTDNGGYKEDRKYDEEEGCPYYDPALAMCSVHVYNVGKYENPVDSNDIQDMKDVIGLKATLVVQQMKLQFDLLKTTMQTLQTQMEKALLTTKMEVLTGNVSGTSSNGKSTGGVLPGAQDCMLASGSGGSVAVATCLQGNLAQVSTASNSGEARKQLEKDLEVAKQFNIKIADSNACTGLTNKSIPKCVSAFQAALITWKEEKEDDSYRRRYGK